MSQAEQSNYEVIRRRLTAAADELTTQLEGLNDERKRVFGGSEIEVTGNERVRTENNCVPRDIVTIGDLLLFGYNVFIGLKQETTVADVFGLHRFEPTADGFDCSAVPLDSAGGFLLDPQFVKDFGNLYRYYREAQLLQLVKSDTQLLAVFQSGASHRETKVFRWNIEGGSRLTYVDDRGDRDYQFARPHDFEWAPVTRDQQESGRFPHYNIEDEIFVDVLSGSLTIKVENNTETGTGIYSEPVEDANQVLDDCQFFSASFGSLILLKVLPFRETEWRYLVYDRRHQKVARIDAIGQACQQLPEDHGIIFPGGYFLQSGEYKVFDSDISDLEFVRALRAPNGEDVVYVYHRRRDGHYSLLFYNMIRKQVQTPIECHGYTMFADGRMVVFRALSDEPTRVHPMQVWATPFSSAEFAASAPTDNSFLARVGNAELVRGISDGFSIVRLAAIEEPSRDTYEEIVGSCERLRDNHYWVGSGELDGLESVVAKVKRAAEQIVDEYEKVVALRQTAVGTLQEATAEVEELERKIAAESWAKIDPFLDALTSLRRERGHLITLRDVRYIDVEAIDGLEKRVVEMFERISRDAVSFLLRDDAFAPLTNELETTLASLEDAEKVADVAPLRDRIEETAEGLGLLGEVMAGIEIEDVTQRTTILERITEVFSHVNAGRATVDGRYRELATREGKAEFSAQLLLLSQTMSSALAMCETPEACEEQMARVIVSVEELESRFSDIDEFVTELADKREDIAEAFSARKQLLLEARQRRAQTLLVAAERILEGVGRRARTLESADDLNGFFAADAMVLKLRQLGEELAELGDTVKADEIASRLLAAKQNALRAVRDKIDLFDDDAEGLIKFGKHRFSVNTQPLDLTLVPRADEMALHLAGTDFYETVSDPEFDKTRELWQQALVSETDDVYRAEYLAYQVLSAAVRGEGPSVAELLADEKALGRAVSKLALERYDEGYERGIHDRDAIAILERLLHLQTTIGLLRFAGPARALAVMFWTSLTEDERSKFQLLAQSRGRLRERLGVSNALAPLATELEEQIRAYAERTSAVLDGGDAKTAAEYLAIEISAPEIRFVASSAAEALRASLAAELEMQGLRSSFDDDMRALEDQPTSRFELAYAWVAGHADRKELSGVLEATAMLCNPLLAREVSSQTTEITVEGLLGHHPRVSERKMRLRADEFLSRLEQFERERVPAFRQYRAARAALIEREKQRLRPDELKPRVMTAFVRNQLISEVYLPLIGDNLAKQIGAAGSGKRTDLMGLLLLISPPGYGKTTLMEYTADRLGLAFVKVNGPSIGHSVTSLDPDEAPNATARAEVEKINLALEMGNNVMLYLDDIQHTNPELLQKFISLCDAQRRIEGVWNGRTRTYDLRGKKFCVVMAGNPYTESGESFQVPDMLANRADVYNLGDVLSGREAMFAKSYIENSLTSNPVLAPLAMREASDIDKLIAMSRGEVVANTELSHGYSQVEIDEITTVLRHLFRIQETLLAVNQLYIESAAQDDAFRTEPPFKLQGSYRNMNKLAEKAASAMTNDEIEILVDDHYAGEAQTLTTESEFNLLKLAQMRGRLEPASQARFGEIVGEFQRQRRMGGGDADPVTRVTAILDAVRESLDAIRSALSAKSTIEIGSELRGLVDSLSRKVEVTVENQPPPGVDKILAEQVALVEKTLVPVVKAATKNLHDGQAFAQQLVQIMELLQGIDHRLDRVGHKR